MLLNKIVLNLNCFIGTMRSITRKHIAKFANLVILIVDC